MSITRNATLLNKDTEITYGYNNYLLSAIYTDLPEYDPSFVENILDKIKQIEEKKIDSYEYAGDGFTHLITYDKVLFEHTIFGECPEWPLWHCTLEQYKAVMQGYRQFLKMPKCVESELFIELPEN